MYTHKQGPAGDEKSLMASLAVSTQYINVTDRRTDGHRTTAKTALITVPPNPSDIRTVSGSKARFPANLPSKIRNNINYISQLIYNNYTNIRINWFKAVFFAVQTQKKQRFETQNYKIT